MWSLWTTANDDNPELDAQREYQQLVEFCQTHYFLTAEGVAVFHCDCLHPDACSDWQQHPDLDAVLAQVMLSAPPPAAAVSSNSNADSFQHLLRLTLAGCFVLAWVVILGAYVVLMLESNMSHRRWREWTDSIATWNQAVLDSPCHVCLVAYLSRQPGHAQARVVVSDPNIRCGF